MQQSPSSFQSLTCSRIGGFAAMAVLIVACGSEDAATQGPVGQTGGAGGAGGSSGSAGSQEDGGTPEGGAGASGASGTAGAAGETSDAGADAADGDPPWTGVPNDRPLNLLFIGNSFTHQGPIPHIVRDMASSVGWPTPVVEYSAPGGQSLAYHSTFDETLALVDAGGWDFVVLQDYSTRPTDNAGDPEGFKSDATWFYDRIKNVTPETQVVLYETWARHPDHSIYPGTFTDPAEMQAQLRFHYNDASDTYIPLHASFQPSTDVQVAPVGDAWETYLAQPDAVRLHASDDYHAGESGQYLNALVLYSTIYGVATIGVADMSLDGAVAQALRDVADETTGITVDPPVFPQPPFAVGQSVRVDFGAIASGTGWNVISDPTTGVVTDAVDANDAAMGVDIEVSDPFSGTNEQGLTSNTLGYPAEVSQDSCWVGSFDGHDEALGMSAGVRFSDVEVGEYELVLYASRTGDDSGAGRLTRYTVAGLYQDLEVSDNASNVAVFSGLTPDAGGNIDVQVAVSPDGTSRFGYVGAMLLTKTAGM